MEQQSLRASLKCEGEILENVYRFKYLGSVFSADSRHSHDVKARIAQAFTRCGKLRHVFDANNLRIKLKLRLYQAAICSILTYDCETWSLTPKVMRQLNGVNSKILSRFTHKSIPQEARSATCSYNLVRAICQRRLKWLGHILRAGPSTLSYKSIEEQSRLGLPGNILMDSPFHTSIGIAALATNRKFWWSLSAKIQ